MINSWHANILNGNEKTIELEGETTNLLSQILKFTKV